MGILKPEESNTKFLQFLLPFFVLSLPTFVALTINLNGEHQLFAKEIYYIFPNRFLPQELVPFDLTPSDVLPEDHFTQSHVFSQVPSGLLQSGAIGHYFLPCSHT